MKYFIATYFSYVLLTILFSLPIFGMRFFSLVSDSMTPQIKPGSFIVVKKQASYDPGDVISFYTKVNDKNEIVVHRITAIGGNVYVTKGDANQYNDRLLALPRLIIGKVIYVFPLLGYFFGAVNSRLGNFLLIILPAAIIIAVQIRRVIILIPEVYFKKNKPEK